MRLHGCQKIFIDKRRPISVKDPSIDAGTVIFILFGSFLYRLAHSHVRFGNRPAADLQDVS